MTGAELRKLIVKTLKESKKPLSLDDIAEKLNIKDTLWILVELNQLTLIGAIITERKGLGGTQYRLVD